MMEKNELTILSPKLPPGFDGIKIVQFSDTHLSPFYTIEQLEKVVDEVNLLSPDIIVFTGDLMDEPNSYNETNLISPVLSKLNAPLGKFAIYGNHDHGGYGTDIYSNVMDLSGFTLLRNEALPIKLLDQTSIIIAGIDDLMLGQPDYEGTLAGFSEEQFVVFLAHEPDAAEQAAGYSVNLQLSGHSHGGQVQVPFYGALVTPPFADIYVEGLYQVRENFQLYVNRGLGTTRIPFRFLSVPEISIFTLKRTKN